ncbi:hypothetical protein LINPERPRIM_LOCUS37062 [Linum perenne]
MVVKRHDVFDELNEIVPFVVGGRRNVEVELREGRFPDGSPVAGENGGLGGGFEVEIDDYEDAVEEFVREGAKSVGGSDGRRRDSEKLETFWAWLQMYLKRKIGHTNPRSEHHRRGGEGGTVPSGLDSAGGSCAGGAREGKKEKERESKKKKAANWPSRRQTQRPLLHRILIATDLDLKSTAKTFVLSRHWQSIWKSSLTKLDFNIPLSDDDEWNSFVQFVEKIMSFHNREYATDLEVLSSVDMERTSRSLAYSRL